ncbi:hypothetical protein C8J57DRAFT_1354528 [Mycena rebaudengoi]|nr:hypothetical protein C8J57DRAFT_1354528 [Mycena rebaudengoi]
MSPQSAPVRADFNEFGWPIEAETIDLLVRDEAGSSDSVQCIGVADAMDIDPSYYEDEAPPPVDLLMEAAEDFLRTVPLRAPKPKTSKRLSRPLNTNYLAPAPKTWTWSGRLVNVTTSEELCKNVTLLDSVVPRGCHNTVRLGAFIISYKKEIELSKFYDLNDIVLLLQRCSAARHFARLVSQEPKDTSLATVQEYMSEKKLVLLLPADLDGDTVGYILLFPPSLKKLLRILNVPYELRKPSGLIVSLVLLKREPLLHYRRHFPRFDIMAPPALIPTQLWKNIIRHDQEFYVGFRVLKIPPSVYGRTCSHLSTLWYTGKDDAPDKDTKYLLRVLQRSPAGVVGPGNVSAEVVFVHVGAMQSLHHMPALAHRRRRPEVLFCTYGTDINVPKNRWGCHELYPIGGVVTFTPEALFNNPWGVVRVIRNLHAHPLWLAYLIPQVLGMAIRLPLEFPDVPPFPRAFHHILEAIEQGELALMRAPSADYSATSSMMRWIREHWICRPHGQQQIWDYCNKAFEAAYSTCRPAAWNVLVRNDILTDLSRMHIQPAIADNYRRFVVLDADSTAETWRGGVEWVAVGRFNFDG